MRKWHTCEHCLRSQPFEGKCSNCGKQTRAMRPDELCLKCDEPVDIDKRNAGIEYCEDCEEANDI